MTKMLFLLLVACFYCCCCFFFCLFVFCITTALPVNRIWWWWPFLSLEEKSFMTSSHSLSVEMEVSGMLADASSSNVPDREPEDEPPDISEARELLDPERATISFLLVALRKHSIIIISWSGRIWLKNITYLWRVDWSEVVVVSLKLLLWEESPSPPLSRVLPLWALAMMGVEGDPRRPRWWKYK